MQFFSEFCFRDPKRHILPRRHVFRRIVRQISFEPLGCRPRWPPATQKNSGGAQEGIFIYLFIYLLAQISINDASSLGEILHTDWDIQYYLKCNQSRKFLWRSLKGGVRRGLKVGIFYTLGRPSLWYSPSTARVSSMHELCHANTADCCDLRRRRHFTTLF